MRLVMPLFAATFLLVDRWGQQNIVFYVALPFLIIVLRMFCSSLLGPAQPANRHGGVRLQWLRWHLLENLAFVVLMLFEIATAIVAELSPATLWPVVFVVVVFYVPYAWLTYEAQSSKMSMGN